VFVIFSILGLSRSKVKKWRFLLMDRFMEIWEETNRWISKVPYTEESHRVVCRLQEEAKKELEAMEGNLQLRRLEVPVVA